MANVILVSGPSGSGKSTLINTLVGSGMLDPRAVLSSDGLRDSLFGSRLVGGGSAVPRNDLLQSENPAIFRILTEMARSRLRQGLDVVLDACSLDDGERGSWHSMAVEFGAVFETWIFDTPVETLMARNTGRSRSVPEFVVKRQLERFQRDSLYPFKLVQEFDAPALPMAAGQLGAAKLDVIGDVHGMRDDLLAVLREVGWELDDQGVLRHADTERKLLFLGDMVDRGPHSLEVLRLVKSGVEAGTVLAIRGNHEERLLEFLRVMREPGAVSRWPSMANADTGVQMLAAEDGRALEKFMQSLPFRYDAQYGDLRIAFVHGDQPSLAKWAPKSWLAHGFSRRGDTIDADALYAVNHPRNEVLVHGHIPGKGEFENVFSLERQAFERGELVVLRVDLFAEQANLDTRANRYQLFESCSVSRRTSFSFEEARRPRARLANDLNSLELRKLAKPRVSEDGLRLYRYENRVFFDNLWEQGGDALLKARGLVLDQANNIVVHPFDKVFNRFETGAPRRDPDTSVVLVEKLNGFLGVVSAHPWKPRPLVTTTGSFDSGFVRYVEDYLTGELRGKILQLNRETRMTLMFEVLHPEDPHIIPYPESMQGLWLIGARELQADSLALPEDALDALADRLGVRRAAWRRATLSDLDSMRGEQVEGWMVREDTPEQRHLFKEKTPYYLARKFIARMSKGKIASMYLKPEGFKRMGDEETAPLVDRIVATFSEKVWSEMTEQARLAALQDLALAC
jgi:predicted kinase